MGTWRGAASSRPRCRFGRSAFDRALDTEPSRNRARFHRGWSRGNLEDEDGGVVTQVATAEADDGVDDSSAAEDVPRAVAGRDPSLPLVLLAHHPRTIERAVKEGVDLQLSGHTHGGQLLPLGWLARLFDPKVAGLGRFGRTWLYVSEGTGFWGPPVRVGTSCEIAAITLVPSTDHAR